MLISPACCSVEPRPALVMELMQRGSLYKVCAKRCSYQADAQVSRGTVELCACHAILRSACTRVVRPSLLLTALSWKTLPCSRWWSHMLQMVEISVE